MVIQRVENYVMDCVRSGSRALRTLALLVLTVAGLLALAIGALVGFMHIAALFMLAAWMGTESLTLRALVLILFMLVLVMYPLWLWRRRRSATIASVRMNRPTVVFEPPASLAACVRCREAYAQARKVIEDAGGIAKWMEWVAR